MATPSGGPGSPPRSPSPPSTTPSAPHAAATSGARASPTASPSNPAFLLKHGLRCSPGIHHVPPPRKSCCLSPESRDQQQRSFWRALGIPSSAAEPALPPRCLAAAPQPPLLLRCFCGLAAALLILVSCALLFATPALHQGLPPIPSRELPSGEDAVAETPSVHNYSAANVFEKTCFGPCKRHPRISPTPASPPPARGAVTGLKADKDLAAGNFKGQILTRLKDFLETGQGERHPRLLLPPAPLTGGQLSNSPSKPATRDWPPFHQRTPEVHRCAGSVCQALKPAAEARSLLPLNARNAKEVKATRLLVARRRRRRRKANRTVLFLGNSFTFYNNMPSLVQSLSATTKKKKPLLVTSMYGPGGYTMKQFAQDAYVTNTLLKGKGKWDYVILQEQSQILSFSLAYTRANSNPYIGNLSSRVRAVGGKPLLFLTWGYQNGDRDNVAGDTYDAMQTRLVAGYTDAAKAYKLKIVPVGLAWSDEVKADAKAGLWQSDGKHPTLQGSYLAACVFYSFLEGGYSPVGNTFSPSGLSASLVKELQVVARDAVKKYKLP